MSLDNDYHFVSLPNPYQGMYFLDRELMDDFAASPAMSPDFGKWSIREKAAAGLTYVSAPKGFTSRNVVPFCSKRKIIHKECWIHHLPDNYAKDPASEFGKLPVETPGLLLSPFEFLRWRFSLRKSPA